MASCGGEAKGGGKLTDGACSGIGGRPRQLRGAGLDAAQQLLRLRLRVRRCAACASQQLRRRGLWQGHRQRFRASTKTVDVCTTLVCIHYLVSYGVRLVLLHQTRTSLRSGQAIVCSAAQANCCVWSWY